MTVTVRSRRWYTSLEAVKAELGQTSTTQDARLKRLIERASAYLEGATHRWFVPVTDTRSFDAPAGARDPLLLDQDLLSATAISDGGGAVALTDVVLYPLNAVRARVIELAPTESWETGTTEQAAISVTGQWGYSADLDVTGAILAAAISSTTATTITVSDGSLIETGWCLLVDNEQLFVTGISGATVAVLRGNNGTTAATHSNATVVYRYVPAPAIEEATAVLATLWYHWQGAGGVKSKEIGDYSVSYVDGWPIPDVVARVVRQHKRIDIRSLA